MTPRTRLGESPRLMKEDLPVFASVEECNVVLVEVGLNRPRGAGPSLDQ